MKRVLFLCTGNYYRSRFAEIVFNHLATAKGLEWAADSCGLRVQADGVVNHGPLSPFTEAGLEMRSIPLAVPTRMPRQACDADFAAAAVVIALKEAEHRPLMESLFPRQVGRVRFWHVHDLDAAPPLAALQEIEEKVAALVEELAGGVPA